MNPFEELCNDTIYIRHQDGRTTGPLKTVFGQSKFTVFDETLDVSEGDIVERPLPNGKAERHDVVHVHFSQGLHEIPASYDLQVRKQGSLVQFQKPSVTNISISNSQGFQVGDHNTQNIIDSFKDMIERIERSSATPEEKKEAKSRLRAFLEHPLTSAIIGGAAGGLTGLLK
jgi:hypothetical protein